MIRPRELSRSIALFPARTPTLPPATHTNSYALGGRDVLLVEPATPYDDEQQAWLSWARALPSTGRRAVAIALTHHHVDHVGGLDVLARELSLPVWAHADTAKMLEPRLGATITRRLTEGETLTLDGPIPESWTVLHTPGHAWGHICLWNEPQRSVVVGDMVASTGTILIAPGDGDMRIYLEQLERLAALDARLALPAHGDPIDAPSLLFRRYIAHRGMREAKVLASLPSAPEAAQSLADLVVTAYADTPAHLWPIAKLSLEAHLEKLLHEGRAARTTSGDWIRAEAASAPSWHTKRRDTRRIMGWESGYVAMSAALGEPLEESVEALGSDGVARAADVIRGLKSRSRASRATALAAVLAVIAADLDRMALE